MADRASTQARFGRAVKRVRVQHGLTQEQVSAAPGLHPTYISDIERGARNPSWEAITKLAHGIGVPTADIAAQFDDGQDAADSSHDDGGAATLSA
jgi:transcriptional regulator with XRE-family HTH domain